MQQHHVLIELLSERWWYTSFLSFFTIAVLIIIIQKTSTQHHRTIQIASGLILLGCVLAIHPVLANNHRWNLQNSLPLHLCGITSILAGFAILFPSQMLYECVLYWGITGGFHSILTPELTEGDEGFLLPQYFIAHGGMIYAALFLTFILNYRPKENSWWKILITTNILAVIIGMINYFLDANYMYLCQPPTANNPLVMGKWPWYILVFEAAGMAHFGLIYFIFKSRKQIV